MMFWATVYSLAMASTALAVLLGCAIEDPKLAQEMLPLLFVPQMLFAGFFVRPDSDDVRKRRDHDAAHSQRHSTPTGGIEHQAHFLDAGCTHGG